MLRTLRTPLAAGAVAAVAAAGLITAPSVLAARLPAVLAAPSSTQVTLTAWQNPFLALLASGEMGENYVFGGYYNGGDAPTPGAGEANWPSAGFDQTGGDLLNYLLYITPELGYYSYVGLLENFAAEADLPAVQQFQINAEDYISVVLSGLNAAAQSLAVGVWDLPGAAVSAVKLALQGQFAAALTVIKDAVIGPIVAAGTTALNAGTYVLSNVVAKASAVVAALPQILKTFAGTAVGGVTVLAQQTAAILSGVVSNLVTFNVEGAWNVAVDGLLGPSGIPGTLFNLVTGAGVQTGPIINPETDIAANFVPSVRTSLQSAQWTIRNALQATPKAAAATAARAAAQSPAAAVGETSAAQVAAVGETSAAQVGETSAAVDSPSPAKVVDMARSTAESAKSVVSSRKPVKRNHAGRAASDPAQAAAGERS